MGSKNSVVSTPLPLDVKNDRYQEYAFIPFDVLQGTERISLHTYRQTPPADLSTAAQHKQAVVIILHGLSQHLGNSAHIARDLSRSGYVVCGYDHRGFGLSEGVRGYI
jgi:acylglycerol lipase